MLKKYKVREGFHVHRKKGGYAGPNDTVEMEDAEAANHAHQIEEIMVETARKNADKKNDQ